jgi:hypothetical protein
MAQASAQSAPAAVPVQAATTKPLRPLQNNRLKLVCSSASDVGNHWAIVVPADVTIETVLLPEFWSNVAPQLRVADTVDVHGDGRDFYAKLYVRDVSRARVSLGLIQHTTFDALAESSEPRAHRVKYAGPHSKWVMERIADGRIMKDGCETKEAAEDALKAIERSLDRKVA